MENLANVMKSVPLIQVVDASLSYRTFPGLTNSLKFELLNRKKRLAEENIALKNVSLEVYEGEVLGIIGRNGAGKSTLAKAIAGMLRPQSGWVITRGNVASMIELSAGINQDMTPYENVRLNSAIYGFPKSEYRKRAERICHFAGIEKQIDEPIRTFSSGMAARFAFALSIDVKPDILIADEILSVGDLDFQETSFNAMKELMTLNKCVIMVSHNLKSIQDFCNRVIWMENGQIKLDGDPNKVTSSYEKNSSNR